MFAVHNLVVEDMDKIFENTYIIHKYPEINIYNIPLLLIPSYCVPQQPYGERKRKRSDPVL